MKLNFEQLDEYRKNMVERIEKAMASDHYLHGYMIYECKQCGKIYIMNLEKGLEDPTEDKNTGEHKPVPFSIVCISCGGEARHILFDMGNDMFGKTYRSWRDMVNESNKPIFRNFFCNDPESKCGVPIIFEPDYYGRWKMIEERDVKETLFESICESHIENRQKRRHPIKLDGFKRPRKNKKLYEY